MRLTLALLLTITAQTALAQDAGVYWGLGLGYSDLTSDGGGTGSGSSVGDGFVFGGTLGYRFATPGRLSYAAEADLDLANTELTQSGTGFACEDGTSAPYYCQQDMTLRLRGLAFFPMSNDWEAFGSLGLGMVSGIAAYTVPGATGRASTAGVTYGFGLQGPVGSGTARFEIIRDDFSETLTNPAAYDPTFQSTTLKATYLFAF